MSIGQLILDMQFDAAFHRAHNGKAFWTVTAQVRDVHVFVTVFNSDVLPVVEMTDGRDRFRTSSVPRAITALVTALSPVVLQ